MMICRDDLNCAGFVCTGEFYSITNTDLYVQSFYVCTVQLFEHNYGPKEVMKDVYGFSKDV